jgi:hypothetical protein
MFSNSDILTFSNFSQGVRTLIETMQLLTGAEEDGNVTIQYCHMTNKCLNRAHRSCDKPLKAKVFFILYPSRAPQLQFNNAHVLWICVETR